MALVSITGKLKNTDKAFIFEYVQELQKELKINRLYSRIIRISFKDKRLAKEGVYGYCYGNDRLVDIEICRTQSWEEQLQTLAHEMVHAKQFFRKELIDGYIYKGRNYWKCEYEHQPWEKSAHAKEEKLFQKCNKKVTQLLHKSVDK